MIARVRTTDPTFTAATDDRITMPLVLSIKK